MRTALTTALLLSLLATLWLTEPPVGLALDEVTVSTTGASIFFLPAEVATQQGFFREQNLDIKYLVTRTEADRAALASGNIDYTLRAGSTMLSAARGLPVRVIFVCTTKPFWALVVRPEAKDVKALKGKSLGVIGLLGSQHIAAKVILKQHGLDADRDVTYRVIQSGARLAAMQAGSLDGAMMDYGEAFRARKAGFRILLNAADYYDALVSGVGVNLNKLRGQPEQVSRFLKAMVKAQAYMRENPEGTQTIMSGWLKVDREMGAEIYQLSINNFTKNGSVEESNLNLLTDRMLAETGIKGVTTSQLVDFALLHQILK
jgi:ABC-type nitrate/sulfonate/bicarbonate transport system substrate-binding protein